MGAKGVAALMRVAVLALVATALASCSGGRSRVALRSAAGPVSAAATTAPSGPEAGTTTSNGLAAAAATTVVTGAATSVAPTIARQCASGGSGSPEPTGTLLLGVVAADGVHEITPDGAHDYRVAGTDGNSQEPAWSADGSRVAFSQRDPGHRTASGNPAANLVVADVAPRCWTALSLQRADAFDWPLWSRDGRGLTYLRHPDGSYMVDHPMYLEMSASDGSGARRLAAVRSPAPWAPDGSGRLVFSDTEGLKLRNPNGQVKTLDAVPDSEFASWSPDSSRILFSVSTNSAVWVVNADGSGLRALTPTFSRSGAFVFFESWSPDGARIAFVRDCCAQPGASSQSDVWVVNADGSDAHAVTSSHDAASWPRWSPAGDEIAYQARTRPDSQMGRVLIIRADGTEARVVASDVELVAYFRRGGGG